MRSCSRHGGVKVEESDKTEAFSRPCVVLTKKTPPSTLRARLPVTFSTMTFCIFKIQHVQMVLAQRKVVMMNQQNGKWNDGHGKGHN